MDVGGIIGVVPFVLKGHRMDIRRWYFERQLGLLRADGRLR